MNTKKIFLFSFLLFCEICTAFCQIEIDKTTFVYAEKDTSILKLDKYRLKDAKEKQPCLFFVFGGGFAAGVRDNKGYLPYIDYFTKKGFTVISIDYRLGMKGQTTVLGPTNYKPLQKAIDMAVEDLYTATTFAIKHADEWGIDTSRVIISGSSAGAVTCLQAEYERRNQMPSSSILPANFEYAGVVSFAGALFITNGGLHWNNKPSPMMLFHGEADLTVPYDQVSFLEIGMYGSKSIVNNLKEKGFSYQFLSFKDADHKISSAPMKENLEEVSQFITDFIFKKRQMQIDQYINEMDKVKEIPKESYKDLYNKKK